MAIASRLVLLFAFVGLAASQGGFNPHRKRDQFRVFYEWKTVDFAWPNTGARENSIASRSYIKENVIPSGIKQYGDKFYVTLPRMKAGVPATLATLPLVPQNNDTHPVFTPYPSWSANEIGVCTAFQSVQSIEIDRNGIMWVIDNGRTATMSPNSSIPTCRPTLSLIDLKDINGASMKFTFPESVVSATSYLNDIVIDESDGGYAYITDNSGMDPGIIVFSKKESRSWKLREANSMRAAIEAVHFNINGTEIDSPVNVDGIALGPRYMGVNEKVDRNVYFSPLASFKLYSVQASVLKNESMVSSPASMTMQLIRELGMKPSQTDGMIMDEDGYLYYGLIGNFSIAQWNSMTNFATEQIIIAKDKDYIQWADRFAFDNVGNIYVVINKLHNFVAGKVDVDKINYRILKANIGVRSYLYGPSEAEVREIYKINQAPPPQKPNNQVRVSHTPTTTPASTSSSCQFIGQFMTIFLAFICLSAYHK